jgi:nitroreductase
MDVFEAIQSRRSIRKYQNRPVEEKKLMQVLEAARLAPSARNNQDNRFIVVQDEKTRKKLQVAAKGQHFVGEAPVVIACCGLNPDYVMSCGQPAYAIDVAIAIDHMTLAARALGLGTCWVGAFYEDQVKNILNIPVSVRVVELMTLGYPDETHPQRPRKTLNNIVCYERWT